MSRSTICCAALLLLLAAAPGAHAAHPAGDVLARSTLPAVPRVGTPVVFTFTPAACLASGATSVSWGIRFTQRDDAADRTSVPWPVRGQARTALFTGDAAEGAVHAVTGHDTTGAASLPVRVAMPQGGLYRTILDYSCVAPAATTGTAQRLAPGHGAPIAFRVIARHTPFVRIQRLNGMPTPTAVRMDMAGDVVRPPLVPAARACRGTVVLTARRGTRIIATRRVPLTSTCRFSGRFNVAVAAIGGARTLRMCAAFAGNPHVAPKASCLVMGTPVLDPSEGDEHTD